MSCGLEEEELFILNTLYGNRCFNDKASFNLKQIANAFKRKFGKDPLEVAKNLANQGYIAQKRKKILNIIYPIWA